MPVGQLLLKQLVTLLIVTTLAQPSPNIRFRLRLFDTPSTLRSLRLFAQSSKTPFALWNIPSSPQRHVIIPFVTISDPAPRLVRIWYSLDPFNLFDPFVLLVPFVDPY